MIVSRVAVLSLFFSSWLCFTNWTDAASWQASVQEEFPNTQKLEIPFTPPEQARNSFELPDGFSVSLFAAEPDIQQPIAVATDHLGRLWVVECFTYSDRQTNYDMTQKDRVVILEDSNNDGKFDKRTLFWDQGEKLTGIEVGMGGIWLTSAPNFLFIPDEDQDDRPDGPPQILLDGFEDDVIRHNIVNGLRWGHDGWLYGRHGIQATSFVGPPNATESQRIAMNCSIWRFHPKYQKFEIVAEGGTNPWGFDFDQHGEMFMINTVIGHLFHVVPGARYRRMYGAHFNPHTYQVIEQTADHFHFAKTENWSHVNKHGISETTDKAGGGHAHTGLMIYLGDNWPQRFRNGLFTANFHGRRINWDTIVREGNGYVGKHAPDLFQTSDPWFRGVEMIYGPDGGVYLLDWSDIGECHENDGIHRTSGRIYKIVYGQPSDNDRRSVDPIQHPNDWHFRKYRRHIQEQNRLGKLDELAVQSLRKTIYAKDASVVQILRSMWTLYSAEKLLPADMLQLSRHANEHIRSWAVRLMTDGLLPIETPVQNRLIELAKSDPSGLVRLYVASGLKRLDSLSKLEIAGHLAQHSGDADDPTQPLLIWYGMEPAVVAHPDQALKIAQSSKLPLLSQFIIRRLAFENDNVECRETLNKYLTTPLSANQQQHLVSAFADAFAGWTSAQQLSHWPEFAQKFLSDPSSQTEFETTVERINRVFGQGPSIDELIRIAKDGSADPLIRRRAIDSVASQKPEDLFEFLKSLSWDKSVLTQVVRSLVHCQTDQVPALVINRFGNCDQEGKEASISTLTSRPQWASQLLRAVADNRIPKSMIRAWHARKISQFANERLDDQLRKVWGEVRTTDASRRQLMAELRSKLQPDVLAQADLNRGHQIFKTNCANCHVMGGEGGRVGPDLTGSDRRNLNYLLENLVDPNSMVAEAYQMKVFLLDDGRTISGLVTAENPKMVQVQTPDEVVTIERNAIEGERKTRLSLMPEGLLDKLTPQQQADLFAYLMKN